MPGIEFVMTLLGLCVQAETFDEWVEVVTALVPELLMENHVAKPDLIPIRVLAERTISADTFCQLSKSAWMTSRTRGSRA
jgi:hypothetical protein